jgi:hypothetical protein
LDTRFYGAEGSLYILKHVFVPQLGKAPPGVQLAGCGKEMLGQNSLSPKQGLEERLVFASLIGKGSVGEHSKELEFSDFFGVSRNPKGRKKKY